jgi:hypothetical protein
VEGRFLREIVTDTTLDDPVSVTARELRSVSRSIRVRRAIGITFQSDGWHGDRRSLGKPVFQSIIFRLTFR